MRSTRPKCRSARCNTADIGFCMILFIKKDTIEILARAVDMRQNTIHETCIRKFPKHQESRFLSLDISLHSM